MVDREVRAAGLEAHPGCAAIQAIPGVSPVLGAVFVAEVGDVARFPTARHLCSCAGQTCGGAKVTETTAGVERHDVRAMLEYLRLLLSLVRATLRDREALVAENLLFRHQLAVLTRPIRKRPHLRTRDKLFWVLVRTLMEQPSGSRTIVPKP